MFLDADEYLLIMEMAGVKEPDACRLTYDELCALRDVGVKTIYQQAAIHWRHMQPAPGAPIDWSHVDRQVERTRRAGLKSLIPFVYSLPDWKPDEFFFSREQVESAYGVPSYTNPEVAAELDDLAREAIARYSGDDCQVIYAIPANGEFALHIWPHHGRIPFGVDVFVDWVVERQKIFAAQSGEVWTAYHPYTDPEYWRPVYNALFDEFADCKHYGIIFTFVQHSMPHFFDTIRWTQARGITYFGGTEYVQGMRGNVPKLVSYNVRMLTAPKHHYQEHQGIDQWTKDEITWAIGEYKNAAL